jgi:hypothetical protein
VPEASTREVHRNCYQTILDTFQKVRPKKGLIANSRRLPHNSKTPKESSSHLLCGLNQILLFRFNSTMIFPKLKLALLICVALVFPLASAVPEDGSVDQFDLQDEDSRDQQPDLTKDTAASAPDEQEPRARKTVNGEGVLPIPLRALRNGAAGAPLTAGNSTGSGSSPAPRLPNRTSGSDASPAALAYIYVSCDCLTGSRPGRTRLCGGTSASLGCTPYTTSEIQYDVYFDYGETVYFYCWCPSSTSLAKRYAVGYVSYNLGYSYYTCNPGTYKTTKSAFYTKCTFTV